VNFLNFFKKNIKLFNSENSFDFYIENPDSIFILKAVGNVLENFGIFDHDLLLVDRSLMAKQGSLIVLQQSDKIIVKPFDEIYNSDVYNSLNKAKIFGVIISVMHILKH
jgi:SOS-response transcriptional repressor LexA